MDEIKDPAQDTSHLEDSSEKGKESTSKDTKTYTKESEEKAVSDALSVAGRDAKSITEKSAEVERILTAAQTTQANLQAEQERWQSGRDEADREAVRQDPEALKSLEERIKQRNEATKLAKERTDLDTDKGKHQESVKADLEQIRIFNRTQLAAEVAVAKGVSLDSILKLTKEDSRKAMEDTAELLPKSKEATALKTDSGITIGGKSLKDLTPDEKIKEGVKLKLKK